MQAKKKPSPAAKKPQYLVLAGITAMVVCFPLFTWQLPSGHDAFSYPARLVEFHENIAHGIFLPRWAPDFEFGAGQPFFLFTGPLPYCAAELWRLLGFDSVTSFNLAAIAAILASAAFMFMFADYQFGPKAGVLAAAAYIYAPYFHVDIFVRHDFSELMAFPLYPLSSYGFCRYARERKLHFLVLGAVAWSGIMLSHNPSALLFSPVLLAFVAFFGWRAQSLRAFVGMLAGICIGIGLAACVWFPALVELRYAHLERTLEGEFRYTDHFVYPQQFFSWTWGYGKSIPGPGDQMSFSVGLGHLLLIPATVWLIYAGKKRAIWPWFVFLGSSLVILIVMMTPASRWLWAHLPLLKQVQFPWRLLGDTSFILAFLAALYGSSLASQRRSEVWFWAGMAVLILPNLSHIGPEGYYPLDTAQWTPTGLAKIGLEPGRFEFEPKWVEQRMAYTDEKMKVLSGSAIVSTLRRSPTFWQVESNAQTDAVLQAALLYFPGWTVSIDGTKTATEIATGTGRIQFHVPSGMHHISIEFRRTIIRFVAELTSLMTLVGVIVIWYWPSGYFSMKRYTSTPHVRVGGLKESNNKCETE
jgi:hypothetical protein